MARPARHDEEEIKVALQMVSTATTLQELRQGQSILLPALAGATMDITAEILGLSRDRVCVLRRQFGERAKSSQMTLGERRGGRHRALMSIEEEKSFLDPWVAQAETGGVLVVPPIHLALEERVGHKVPKSTVYRLLARHGWRNRGLTAHKKHLV